MLRSCLHYLHLNPYKSTHSLQGKVYKITRFWNEHQLFFPFGLNQVNTGWKFTWKLKTRVEQIIFFILLIAIKCSAMFVYVQ